MLIRRHVRKSLSHTHIISISNLRIIPLTRSSIIVRSVSVYIHEAPNDFFHRLLSYMWRLSTSILSSTIFNDPEGRQQIKDFSGWCKWGVDKWSWLSFIAGFYPPKNGFVYSVSPEQKVRWMSNKTTKAQIILNLYYYHEFIRAKHWYNRIAAEKVKPLDASSLYVRIGPSLQQKHYNKETFRSQRSE